MVSVFLKIRVCLIMVPGLFAPIVLKADVRMPAIFNDWGQNSSGNLYNGEGVPRFSLQDG
jgi:hypothetical protein